MVDLLPDGGESTAQLAVGEMRDDGSIDLLLLLESGTLRYITTIGARDSTGIVPAPEPYRHLTTFTQQVFRDNAPIIRRPSTTDSGFVLSVFPLHGIRRRVVFILEPEASARPRSTHREA